MRQRLLLISLIVAVIGGGSYLALRNGDDTEVEAGSAGSEGPESLAPSDDEDEGGAPASDNAPTASPAASEAGTPDSSEESTVPARAIVREFGGTNLVLACGKDDLLDEAIATVEATGGSDTPEVAASVWAAANGLSKGALERFDGGTYVLFAVPLPPEAVGDLAITADTVAASAVIQVTQLEDGTYTGIVSTACHSDFFNGQ